MVLHHAPVDRAAIEEMTRILKQGGRLVSPMPTRTLTNGCAPRCTIDGLGFDRVDIARWLREAGLQGASVIDITNCALRAAMRHAGGDHDLLGVRAKSLTLLASSRQPPASSQRATRRVTRSRRSPWRGSDCGLSTSNG